MNIRAKLLKVKLLWLLMVFALVPMLFIALYSYFDIRKQMIDSELSHLSAIAQLKSMQIEDYYDECENNLQTIVNSPYTKLALSNTSNKQAKRLYVEQLNDFILNHDINTVFIIGLNGKIVAAATRYKENNLASYPKSAFAEGKGRIYFSDIFKNISCSSKEKNKRYCLTGSAPILDENNKLIGVIVAQFRVNNFFDSIQDYSGLGKSGETLLGKRVGDQIVFLNPLRHDPNAGMNRHVRIDGKIAIPVIRGATGHNESGESIDYRDVKVLAAWRYVPVAGWGLVAKIDKDEALKPLVSIRHSIALTAIVLLIGGLFASLKMANNIISPVDKLETEAHMDILTGLPNRKLLMGLLEQALNKAKLKDAIVAIMFLDLDGFKSVNDTYGHETGDVLLKNVALRLTNCVRQSDTVARLGGDEFVILLHGAKEISNIEKIAAHIIQSLNEEYSINETVVRVGASIGISIFPNHAMSADDMLRKADKAMYEAKKDGKNNYKFTKDDYKKSNTILKVWK